MVVVERDGEWQPALVLGRSGDRCLIHTCPGYGVAEMSENEWVQVDRVRFSASSTGRDGSARDSSDSTGAFGADPWGGPPKKGPVPAEV